MEKLFLKTATFLGALSVGLGAFAAHSLKQIFTTDNVQIFETAVRYQFYHVFAILVVSFMYQRFPYKLIKWAGICFISGIIFFSGSLYLLCFIKYQNLPLLWVGAITPFGGLLFILGWIFLFFSINKYSTKI